MSTKHTMRVLHEFSLESRVDAFEGRALLRIGPGLFLCSKPVARAAVFLMWFSSFRARCWTMQRCNTRELKLSSGESPVDVGCRALAVACGA